MNPKSIYLDYNATWPVEDDHLEWLFSQLKTIKGNPSSNHSVGQVAKIALEEARQSFARLLGVRDQTIIFTSGATEANNAVIQGIVFKHLRDQVNIIISATEHPSIVEPVKSLYERELCNLNIIAVDKKGTIDVECLLAALTPQTKLVCLIYVNNEVGTINPVFELALAIKSRYDHIHVHVDAVQALGKILLVNIESSAVDSMSFSGHKIGALKGIGALYLRSGIKLMPLLIGGAQERNRRSGTENLEGIISFGKRILDLLVSDGVFFPSRKMQLLLVEELQTLSGVTIHGDPLLGVSNTVNFHVEGVRGDDILLNLDLNGIQASSGSACSSGVGRPSHVLKAMGYSEEVALNSVRISLGARSGAEEIAALMKSLGETISRAYHRSAPGNVRALRLKS